MATHCSNTGLKRSHFSGGVEHIQLDVCGCSFKTKLVTGVWKRRMPCTVGASASIACTWSQWKPSGGSSPQPKRYTGCFLEVSCVLAAEPPVLCSEESQQLLIRHFYLVLSCKVSWRFCFKSTLTPHSYQVEQGLSLPTHLWIQTAVSWSLRFIKKWVNITKSD